MVDELKLRLRTGCSMLRNVVWQGFIVIRIFAVIFILFSKTRHGAPRRSPGLPRIFKRDIRTVRQDNEEIYYTSLLQMGLASRLITVTSGSPITT